MYRFMRTATVKNASALVSGLKFAAEVSAHFDKKYSMDMKHGVEIFGKHTIYWHFESNSVDMMIELNAKLMQDKEYQALLEKYKDVWVEGSLKDTLVAFA